MIDATYTLSDMVEGRYDMLAGHILAYDETPPDGVQVYAQLGVVGNERDYVIQGGGGRQDTRWTLRLTGPRDDVRAAGQELPEALDMPWRNPMTGAVVMYTHLMRSGPIARLEQPAGAAAQVLHFESHIIQQTPDATAGR